MKKELDSHKLGIEGAKASLQGDKVVLDGEVKDQGAFGKAFPAVNSITDVASVRVDGLKVAGAAPGAATMYTVKSGGNLWKIAEAHYGNGDKHTLIFEANRPMLTRLGKIYPGRMLRIPPLS